MCETCKTFNSVINENSRLWNNIGFEFHIELNEEQLERILIHARGFRTLLLPLAITSCDISRIDYCLVKYLPLAKSLYWLDLSNAHLSTLSFLEHLPSLELLNITNCPHLVDPDFHVIKKCKKLDQLYISFNNVSSNTVVAIANETDLTVLDTSGIELSIKHCKNILSTSYSTLLWFHVSVYSRSFKLELDKLKKIFFIYFIILSK